MASAVSTSDTSSRTLIASWNNGHILVVYADMDFLLSL